MLYELRIYTMYSDRMDAIKNRFADHTFGIFKRRGLKVYDFWIDANNEPKLYYIMEYKDIEDRNTRWNAFREDPEWVEVKTNSEISGPIVKEVQEIYMHRADFFKSII
jgi:hypothetical protein